MFNANIISLVLCLQCLLLLPEQLDLAVHRHIQNISSWIRHLDLLFQRPADFFADNWILIKKSPRQSLLQSRRCLGSCHYADAGQVQEKYDAQAGNF